MDAGLALSQSAAVILWAWKSFLCVDYKSNEAIDTINRVVCFPDHMVDDE